MAWVLLKDERISCRGAQGPLIYSTDKPTQTSDIAMPDSYFFVHKEEMHVQIDNKRAGPHHQSIRDCSAVQSDPLCRTQQMYTPFHHSWTDWIAAIYHETQQWRMEMFSSSAACHCHGNGNGSDGRAVNTTPILFWQ